MCKAELFIENYFKINIVNFYKWRLKLYLHSISQYLNFHSRVISNTLLKF